MTSSSPMSSIVVQETVLPSCTKLSSITKQKKRKVYFGGKDFHETKVFNRINLPKLFKEDGPLIIEERESTLVIPPNFNVKLDLNGNLIVTRVNENV